MEKMDLCGGELCDAATVGTDGLTIFYPADPDMDADSRTLAAWAAALAPGRSFRLVGFSVRDWDRALSPWEAPGAFKKQHFAGEGRKTLDWLVHEVLPAWGGAGGAIAGYSLGGLFALWAFHECRCFRAAASCSGSLWYPGWMDYLASAAVPEGSRVYLSLGEREAQAKNKTMARVGDVTRETAAFYAASGAVRDATLVWHPGGHFADPAGRLAAGIAWLAACEAAAGRPQK